MIIKVYNLPTANPFQNLATEEYVLLQHTKSQEDIILLFYENIDSIILGKLSTIKDEVFAYKTHIPIIRRLSGGRTVMHFIGNINYSVILSLEYFPDFFNIKASYQTILNEICTNLPHHIFSQIMGISDISSQQAGMYKKISGNSQVRKQQYLLHHGTMIYHAGSIKKIMYYLNFPSEQPAYRMHRNHKDFLVLTNPSSKMEVIRYIMQAMQNVFQTSIHIKNIDIFNQPEARICINRIIRRMIQESQTV